MFQDIDFENMSYEEGLALVAAQRPLEKQAFNLDDIKGGAADFLSNPYAQYGLIGAGVGGLGGLASSLLKEKRRRNYGRSALTGATLGGLGGLAVRGGLDSIGGLADVTSATDDLQTEDIKESIEDPSISRKLMNIGKYSLERFKSDMGFPSALVPGAKKGFPSTAEFEDSGGGSSLLVPGGAALGGLTTSSAIDRIARNNEAYQLLKTRFGEDVVRHAQAQKLLPHRKFGLSAPDNYATWKDWWQNMNKKKPARPYVQPGTQMSLGDLIDTTAAEIKKLDPSSPLYHQKKRLLEQLKKLPKNSPNWRKAYQEALKEVTPTGTGVVGKTKNIAKNVTKKTLWALLPAIIAHMVQTEGSGYADEMNKQLDDLIE